MRERWIRGLACLCCLALLSGCVKPETAESSDVSATLPPAGVSYTAPDGDEPFVRGAERTLYLPTENELHLTAYQIWIESDSLADTAEQLTRRQLEAQSELLEGRLGENRKLSLYGGNPVECSGGICTVNLSTAALQLSSSELYKVCIALATTLCDLDEISFVNILIADQSVGMDITGSLAMGSLTGHPNENLPVLWEQMEAKRTPVGDDLSRTPLNALATLYYPLEEGRGIGCENRILNYDGQTPQQLASGLMAELEEVIRENTADSEGLSLRELMLHEPLTSELEDGGRLITLSFREDAEEKLADMGLDMACTLASLTYTMTTFIPGIAAVCVRIGDKVLTELRSASFGTISVLGGLLRREFFSRFLRGSATVFLAKNGRLKACEHPVDRNMEENPRTLLSALMAGPTGKEAEAGLEAALPEGVFEDDILGIAREGDTLLVNLSESFRAEIQAFGAERERLLCYSMVNTLCTGTGSRRICFFFEGEQVEQIAGSIYWAGTFMNNPGMAE
ncbi:MAG: GerMN domain-containing protein [Clostridia bacterium]|nr:GerMN domain-containing protein [Clostridia bacterium]